MGFFDPPVRPKKIKVLDVQNHSSNPMISYTATFADKSIKNVNTYVKYLNTSFIYSLDPHIIKAECIGRVYIGFLKSDTRLIFLVTLSDLTMDLIQEKDGTTRCVNLLAKAMGEDTAERTTKETSGEAADKTTKKTSIEKRTEYRDTKEDIDIPIEILPNLYSLSLSNVSIKLAKYYKDGIKAGENVNVKCRVNYSLNGRKEGKRYIIFTSYDDKDGVIEIRGDYEKYHFTAAGHEFVEVFFPDYDKYPIKKISISVKEI